MNVLQAIAAPALSIGLSIGAVGLCAMVERRWPARPAPHGHRTVNMAMNVAATFFSAFALPMMGIVVTLIVNRAGGGLIGLPDHGWALAASIVIYAVAMDFSEYAFHRAQHAIPFLWRMHSLHHSEPHYNATTALRSFWLEPYLKSISVWLVVGIVFKTSSAIATGYFVLTFYNYIIHANARIHYGPLSWLLNTPAYHRIHHSALPEHSDCNYAAIFPIFDVLFGAYRPPPPGVYPPTGLVQDAPPVTLLQALAWPLERAQRSATGG